MFAIVFFRLWYLQILSGDKYLAEAQNNQVRDILIQAPRGKIVDRNGTVLVDNRIGYAVTISPDKLPQSQAVKTALYSRLARVLGISRRAIRTSVRTQLKAQPFAQATVKEDVSRPVFEYILEHESSFPGVTVERDYLRYYPHRDLAVGVPPKENALDVHAREARLVLLEVEDGVQADVGLEAHRAVRQRAALPLDLASQGPASKA